MNLPKWEQLVEMARVDVSIYAAVTLNRQGTLTREEAAIYAALCLQEQLRLREQQVMYMVARGATLPPDRGVIS